MSGIDQRVEALFEATVALGTVAERTAFLARECPDPELRSEIESLVACYHDPDPVFVQKTKVLTPEKTGHSNFRDRFLGQTLDEKYRLDQFQGQGGMGAVYLSTHLGTGRYVAVKLIAPEFMRNQEFFRRFKREAQAAGRLRHPNIVDVTDFGIAQVGEERIAYLVMEYLDGCSLSEVLSEEKRLPLRWVVDILEQVCSAVHEAHQQGIIHRDLKPANIWLEPNTLGGYRVKVLDFGIAKLAEVNEAGPGTSDSLSLPIDSSAPGSSEISPDSDLVSPRTGPAGTHLISPETELKTAPPGRREEPSSVAEELTRAGAILGTPAYMSPEQCRAQSLDARSDIYSLGIIAYQMLSGTLPFSGGTDFLLQAHQASRPPPLFKLCKNVPKAVSRLIMSALEKDPDARPQTANAFAQALRANAEELGMLYRRAFALYSEYFPQVIKISLMAHIPVVMVSAISVGLALNQAHLGKGSLLPLQIGLGVLKGIATFVTGSIISGMIALIVVGLAATPLKPVTLGSSFAIVRRRLRPLLKTGLLATLRILLGGVLLIVPGLIALVRYSLWTPVVLLEGLENKPALRRARELAARSWRTCILAAVFQILTPGLTQWAISGLIYPASGRTTALQESVIAEITGLGSILVTPLVSIVLALVYVKMRQLGGELVGQLLPQIKTGSHSRWEQQIRTRLSSRTKSA
jgi:serine/threonine protein kinase